MIALSETPITADRTARPDTELLERLDYNVAAYYVAQSLVVPESFWGRLDAIRTYPMGGCR